MAWLLTGMRTELIQEVCCALQEACMLLGNIQNRLKQAVYVGQAQRPESRDKCISVFGLTDFALVDIRCQRDKHKRESVAIVQVVRHTEMREL